MQNVQVIIINNCFYKNKICGINLCDWLKNNIQQNCLILNSIDEIKGVTLKKDYALVLFSSYPLIKESDLKMLAELTQTKQLSFCEFNGGYFIKSQLINQKINNFTSNSYNFDYNLEINDNLSLHKVKREIQKIIIENHINNGVIFENENNVIIDATVKISNNVFIGNNCELYGDTIIGQNGQVLSNSTLINVKAQANVKIISSHLEECFVCEAATVGPFARIRKGVEVGKNCKIGNFVELKQAKIAKNTKISHLTYVGDAQVGENCNLGCGVVFCNYDGKSKHKTVIGDNCFIGSNVNLVAPIEIGDNCFIACGSTITKNLKKNLFAIERSEQIIKNNKFKK